MTNLVLGIIAAVVGIICPLLGLYIVKRKGRVPQVLRDIDSVPGDGEYEIVITKESEQRYEIRDRRWSKSSKSNTTTKIKRRNDIRRFNRSG